MATDLAEHALDSGPGAGAGVEARAVPAAQEPRRVHQGLPDGLQPLQVACAITTPSDACPGSTPSSSSCPLATCWLLQQQEHGQEEEPLPS
jgi:hypothetical protein